jgi:uncharacterized protein YjbJ (UPF0337 family)
MSNHEIEGRRKKVEGTVRKGVGKVTGDKSEQIRGEGEKIQGTVEEGAARAKRKMER